MNDAARPVTHYDSKSQGRIAINDMAHPHLARTIALLKRTEGDARTIEAMEVRLAELDALPDDAARIAATTPGMKQPPATGHNKPPKLETFEAVNQQIEDIYGEAKNWLDGAPIANQAQADEVSRLRGMMREAAAAAETLRVAEKKPFDEKVAAIQSKYAPLIADTKSVRGKAVVAEQALLAALTPWLAKLDEEHQARLDAARETAAKAIEEVHLVREIADPSRLDDAEVVEDTIQTARAAERTVRQEEGNRARVGGGEFRSTLLRDNWVPHLTDAEAALVHYWKMQRGAVEAFLGDLAVKDVRAGKRAIPGFDVKNDKRAA